MADSLGGEASHGRALDYALGDRLAQRRRVVGAIRRRRRGSRPGRRSRRKGRKDLLGVPGQRRGGRGLLVGNGGDDAEVDDEEAHAQEVEAADAVLELGALGSPEQACAGSHGTGASGDVLGGDEQSVELLAQIVAVLLDLAQQLAEADLVLEALDLGHVAVVALVFLDGKVDRVDEDAHLAGGDVVGGPVGANCLSEDDDGEKKGGQDKDERPLEQARIVRHVEKGGAEVSRRGTAAMTGERWLCDDFG